MQTLERIVVESPPAPERREVRKPTPVAPSRRGTRPVVPPAVIGVAWVVAWALVASVAPETDPAVAPTALELLLGNLALAGMVMTAAGLAVRSGLAGAGALLGGGVFAFASISCWATGHIGTWIAVQFAAGLALALVGLVGLVTARR